MVFSSFLLQSVISRAFAERLAPEDGYHLSSGCLELLVVNLLEGKDGKNPGNTGCQMQVMVLICDPNASGCWSGGCWAGGWHNRASWFCSLSDPCLTLTLASISQTPKGTEQGNMDVDGPFPFLKVVSQTARELWSECGCQGTMGHASYRFFSLEDAVAPAFLSPFSFGF